MCFYFMRVFAFPALVIACSGLIVFTSSLLPHSSMWVFNLCVLSLCQFVKSSMSCSLFLKTVRLSHVSQSACLPWVMVFSSLPFWTSLCLRFWILLVGSFLLDFLVSSVLLLFQPDCLFCISMWVNFLNFTLISNSTAKAQLANSWSVCLFISGTLISVKTPLWGVRQHVFARGRWKLTPLSLTIMLQYPH